MGGIAPTTVMGFGGKVGTAGPLLAGTLSQLRVAPVGRPDGHLQGGKATMTNIGGVEAARRRRSGC